jgi:hypothetical protein
VCTAYTTCHALLLLCVLLFFTSLSYCMYNCSLSDIIGGKYSFQVWLIKKSYCEKLFYLSTDTSHFGCGLIQKTVRHLLVLVISTDTSHFGCGLIQKTVRHLLVLVINRYKPFWMWANPEDCATPASTCYQQIQAILDVG